MSSRHRPDFWIKSYRKFESSQSRVIQIYSLKFSQRSICTTSDFPTLVQGWKCKPQKHIQYKSMASTDDGDKPHCKVILAILSMTHMSGCPSLLQHTVPAQSWRGNLPSSHLSGRVFTRAREADRFLGSSGRGGSRCMESWTLSPCRKPGSSYRQSATLLT